MFPSAICRLSVPLAASIFRASIAVAEPITVGAVDKGSGAGRGHASRAEPVRWLSNRKSISEIDATAEGARLQATLKDRTQLTLGENATVGVDEFIYDPVMSRGELSIRVVKGAFLYVGGRIEGVNGGEGANLHAGRGDRPAGHHRLGRPNR